MIALVTAVFSFAASGSPDGLERVAEDHGFIGTALDPIYNLLPDYTIPFIANETLSGIVAVVVGTLLVFGIAIIIGRTVRTQSAKSHS
ncbi:MAG: PDGLE domain-containing protein [Caldilineaceae bacterium]